MSFATRFCENLVKNGLRLMPSSSTRVPFYNYHQMARPIAIGTAVGGNNLGYNGIASVLATVSQTSGLLRLLTPFNSLLTQVAGFKVKAKLRRRCKDCYFVIRQQRHYVICPTHPRHKQMSMKKRDYKSWILTHATQSKTRPY